jgi:hypothetical protein
MHSRSSLPALAIAALCVAACGSSGPRVAGASSSVSHTRPTQIYRVRLGGGAETPRGAPLGQGDAIISFHGDSVICWRFAHLHGFTDATSAHIQAGTNGRSGAVVVALSTAPRLHHQGCASVSPTLGKAIMSNPGGYYVNIRSIRYPAGAVRAQL